MSTTIPRNYTREEHKRAIEEIGVARFVGRINSEVVESDVAYQVLQDYIAASKKRPWPSKLTRLILGCDEPYDAR